MIEVVQKKTAASLPNYWECVPQVAKEVDVEEKPKFVIVAQVSFVEAEVGVKNQKLNPQ